MKTPDAFVKELKDEVLAHPASDHPIFERIRSGGFTPEAIRRFSVQFYHCYGNFNEYIALLIPRIPDEAMRILMARNLVDELGNLSVDKTHPALFRRFLRALDLGPEDWASERPLPAVSLHVDRHYRLCSTDLLRGLATIGPGTEWSVPNWFTKVVHGLVRYRQFEDEDLAYWTVHITLDMEHSSDAELLLQHYATSEEAQRGLREGAFLSLDATRLMLDELQRYAFGAG